MSGAGAYPTALGLTLLVELPVYAVVLRLLGVAVPRGLLAGALANLVTHPLLWLALRPWTGGTYAAAFVVGEALVCAVEALVLALVLRRYRLGVARLAALSVLANALSAGIGLAVGLVLAVLS